MFVASAMKEGEDMMEEVKINYEGTPEITCPHCGVQIQDSWEITQEGENLGLMECDGCGKSFYAFRNITVTYSTKFPTYGTCGSCGDENVVIENWHSSVGQYQGLCLICGEQKKREAFRAALEG